MNKPPAFQFYPDDFIGGTVALTTIEVGAYMRLLCYQWGQGKIPEEKEDVDRVAGVIVSAKVLAKFPSGKNRRMEFERRKQNTFRKERSKSGAYGAKKRWLSHSSANGTAKPEPMAKHSSPSPSPSPSPISKEDKTYTAHARAALHMLNEKSGKHFRESETSLAPINARLSEPGVTIEGVKQMISRQCIMWKDTRMQEYLRPETLFGKEKFNSYYAAKDMPVSFEDHKLTNGKPKESLLEKLAREI